MTKKRRRKRRKRMRSFINRQNQRKPWHLLLNPSTNSSNSAIGTPWSLAFCNSKDLSKYQLLLTQKRKKLNPQDISSSIMGGVLMSTLMIRTIKPGSTPQTSLINHSHSITKTESGLFKLVLTMMMTNIHCQSIKSHLKCLKNLNMEKLRLSAVNSIWMIKKLFEVKHSG